MKRYVITEDLRQAIRNSKYSMRFMSRQIGFTVKNMLYNWSINEHHLQKLQGFLPLNNLRFQEYEQDYAKNLGIYAFSEPIEPVKKSEDLAEFIGVLLGDGNLCRDCISIACDKRWNDYILYLKKLFRRLFAVSFKVKTHPVKNVVYLYFYSKKMMEMLLNLELKRGDKIFNKIIIPSWIKENARYLKRCLRGLIDTDGCVYFCKREKRIYVGFTNHNLPLLEDFKICAKKVGYSFAKGNKWNCCLYRKDEVKRFIDDIQPIKASREHISAQIKLL